MPARCFVFWVLRIPEVLFVFSTMVVMLLCCFRNFLALSFFVIQRVFLGNFRMAIFPIMSWGIFFIRRDVVLDIKGFVGMYLNEVCLFLVWLCR